MREYAGYADGVRYLVLARKTAVYAVGCIGGQLPRYKRAAVNLMRDIKVAADRKLDKLIVKELRNSSPFSVLSEEGNVSLHDGAGECVWIVDPLDGSVNFSRDIPISCVSIALWKGKDPLLGAVYDFNRDEMFTGLVGKGAWINGRPVKVSAVSEKIEAISCIGFPAATSFSKRSVGEFVNNVVGFKKVRLLGSAALSLAYLSCGRADYYHEDDIKIWDVAGGLALVKAAGGRISITTSKRKAGSFCVSASNGRLPLS